MALYLARTPLVFASGVAVPLTGSVAETTLASITVPAGSMGINGWIDIETIWSVNNDASAKSMIIKFGGTGGTAFLNANIASTAQCRNYTSIQNRGSASSQVGGSSAVGNGWGATAGGNTTAAINSAADVSLLIRGTLADSADTITLECYKVKVWFS